MLTAMVDLEINFCCCTNIDLSLYYICSLLYYWDDQLPKLCMSTVQIPRIGIIFVYHGGVMILGEQLMWLFLYKYYGYIKEAYFLC